jgi:hypothetical protein
MLRPVLRSALPAVQIQNEKRELMGKMFPNDLTTEISPGRIMPHDYVSRKIRTQGLEGGDETFPTLVTGNLFHSPGVRDYKLRQIQADPLFQSGRKTDLVGLRNQYRSAPEVQRPAIVEAGQKLKADIAKAEEREVDRALLGEMYTGLSEKYRGRPDDIRMGTQGIVKATGMSPTHLASLDPFDYLSTRAELPQNKGKNYRDMILVPGLDPLKAATSRQNQNEIARLSLNRRVPREITVLDYEYPKDVTGKLINYPEMIRRPNGQVVESGSHIDDLFENVMEVERTDPYVHEAGQAKVAQKGGEFIVQPGIGYRKMLTSDINNAIDRARAELPVTEIGMMEAGLTRPENNPIFARSLPGENDHLNFAPKRLFRPNSTGVEVDLTPESLPLVTDETISFNAAAPRFNRPSNPSELESAFARASRDYSNAMEAIRDNQSLARPLPNDVLEMNPVLEAADTQAAEAFDEMLENARMMGGGDPDTRDYSVLPSNIVREESLQNLISDQNIREQEARLRQIGQTGFTPTEVLMSDPRAQVLRQKAIDAQSFNDAIRLRRHDRPAKAKEDLLNSIQSRQVEEPIIQISRPNLENNRLDQLRRRAQALLKAKGLEHLQVG